MMVAYIRAVWFEKNKNSTQIQNREQKFQSKSTKYNSKNIFIWKQIYIIEGKYTRVNQKIVQTSEFNFSGIRILCSLSFF
jgi:hypothetical protein